MHNFNSHDFEKHYRQIVLRTKRRIQRMLDRFGQSLYEWLTAALNWPEEDWQADLENFVAHSRMTGIELSAESLAEIRGLVEARVQRTGVFAERARSDGDHGRPTIQLAALTIAPDSDTDATVDLSEGPKEEVAGPGPETSKSFKDSVQRILQLLDPLVAKVWEDHGGIVRSWTRGWLEISFSYHTESDGDHPVIVVRDWFTARDVAMAILEAACDRRPNPISSRVVDEKIYTAEEIEKLLREIQTEAFKQAAAEAAYIAEIYIGSVASLTPAGDLIVTIDEVSRNGWDFGHLLSALPMLAHFRKSIKRLILKLPGGKTLELPGKILEKLSSLSENRRNKLITRAKTAKSKEEALSILKREIAATARGGQVHHLISGKVYNALRKHKVLKGKYSYRDKRFEVIAVSEEAHRGWAEWHRKLDDEVAIWIGRNQSATQSEFENWLRWRYSQPDLTWRFAIGTQ